MTQEKTVKTKGIKDGENLKTKNAKTKGGKEMSKETKNIKEIDGKKMKKAIISDAKLVQKLVKETVDNVSEDIERVHQKVVSLPIEYIGKIKRMEKISKDVQEIQENAIGHVYDLVRIVNEKVNDVTLNILKKAS
jgi:hypothetical protein